MLSPSKQEDRANSSLCEEGESPTRQSSTSSATLLDRHGAARLAMTACSELRTRHTEMTLMLSLSKQEDRTERRHCEEGAAPRDDDSTRTLAASAICNAPRGQGDRRWRGR